MNVDAKSPQNGMSSSLIEDDDGLIEADDDYEEYFFRDHGEGEQYVKVVEDNPISMGPSGSD